MIFGPGKGQLALFGLGMAGFGLLVLTWGRVFVRRIVERRRRSGFPRALVDIQAFVGVVAVPVFGGVAVGLLLLFSSIQRQ